jgi:hypothetical protein
MRGRHNGVDFVHTSVPRALDLPREKWAHSNSRRPATLSSLHFLGGFKPDIPRESTGNVSP